ncbi:MAG: EamA family transporter RarD [Oxalobacteraceae bacterium]|jgi:chloramphenicol-sensitive protein RarD|nr:EamA family transporter RarD [Oxalobacteraceae bacterium]
MLAGILSTATAFTLWGIFPLYLKLLKSIPALEILSHRVVWSIVLLAVILGLRRQWTWVNKIRQRPRIALVFVASAAMLATNWVVYIWAVGEQRIIDASLGYFITPLFNVLFGIMLGERLRNAQWLAIAFAACGVIWLTIGVGQLPWIGLTLAVTFSLYGLLRKTAPLGALEGLTAETLVMLPLAALFLLLPNSGSSHAFTAGDTFMSGLLLAAGPVTAVPLLLFAFGARRIPLSMLGLLQYIGPSIQLLLGIWLYHEPFGENRLIGFALIWAGLIVYSVQGIWRTWRPRSEAKNPD